MKFIIDAHLPVGVGEAFTSLGHQVIHTRDLPEGNATDDSDIISIAAEDGIVIIKDIDFLPIFFTKRQTRSISFG